MDITAFAALMKRKRGQKGLSQQALAVKIYGDESRKGDISRLENARIQNPQEKTIRLICDALDISDAEMEPIRQARLTAQALDQVPTLSRDDLELLAARFDITGVPDRSDEDLRKLLTLKAQEYRALKSEVDAIEDGLKRLSNLKSAAQDAIARVDLEEVEEILSRVQEVEKEEAAKTAELRADNALLRGRVDQAYSLLCDAADSFAIIDPLEPARRKILRYAPRFGRHGMRFGGDGLQRSIQLMRDTATDDLRALDPWLWAAGKNAEAIGLRNEGTRTEGHAGADLLAEAVTAYRTALEVTTRADHPEDWAKTQNNLANALADQGIRAEGAAGADLLAEAVTAYRAALEVYTRDDLPLNWAMAQNNLGIALQNQGVRAEGAAGADLLAQAVAAYRAALEVYTRADHSVDWASTQNNLAIALQNRGTRTDGPTGADLLAEAVTAFRAALEVRTRAAHPIAWAETQENIAITLLSRADHDSTEDPRPDLTTALQAVDLALTIYDPVHLSYHHATATRLRDDIAARLAAL